MTKLFRNIKQYLHRMKVRKLCIFDGDVTIDSFDDFEGMNRLAAGVTLLTSCIGYASYIGNNSFIKNTKIGRYTCIANDVVTVSGKHPVSKFVSIHPAFYSVRKQSGFTYVNENKFEEFNYIDDNKKFTIIIGNDVWIGSGVKIMESLTIGDGAIIAAGAIVTKDIPPYAIVGGIPAKFIKYRFEQKTIQKLLKFKWWNQDIEWIKKHADKFEDIEQFVANI